MINLNLIATTQERQMESAFLEAIADIKGTVKMRQLEALIADNNVDGVIKLLGLEPQAFEGMGEQLVQSYRVGGMTGASQIGLFPSTIGDISLRFSMRSPAAENWLAKESSKLITEMAETQKEVVRATLLDGMANGDNPRRTALDLVGTVQPKGGRVGGFVGLTTQQQGWINNARLELESLSPRYFSRELRDKRFDAMIRKAIATDTPLSSAQINKIIIRMQDKALKYRADVIARTESIKALKAGQYESVLQAIDKGEVDAQDVTKEWDATENTIGGRTRDSHVLMEGQKRAIKTPFDFPYISKSLPDGQAQFPSDDSLGAPASQLIQCRCKLKIVIDFLGQLKRIEGFS